jgi:hypothetical protein
MDVLQDAIGKQTQIGLLPRFTASHQGQMPLMRS